MAETPISLLERLRLNDAGAWQRLVDLYTPLLQHWARRSRLQDADADDLVQEVLRVLIKELPHFEHRGRPGAFRKWLRQTLVNRLKDFIRTEGRRPHGVGGSEFQRVLSDWEDPDSELSRAWDREYDRHVAARLLERILPDFHATTREAFVAVAIRGEPPADAARRLGISVNAVLVAKSRVLQRLRAEADGILD